MPEASAQNDLADVVTSVEYYLESLLEGRPDIELSMNSGNEAADRLNVLTDSQGVEDSVESDEPKSAPVVIEEDNVEISADELESAAEIETVVEESSENQAEEERYIVLSDDADEEILEIFIEEAMEELASLSEQVPIWSNNHNDDNALATIRRSFHTLKGSGRLIGAQLIGEFAWAFESMLNRVIEKTCPLTQEVFDVLDESLAVLPQLIEQLKGNREPIPNIYKMMDTADALGKFKKPSEDNKPKTAAPDVQAVNAEELAPAPIEEIIEEDTEEDTEEDILEISGDEIGLGSDFEMESEEDLSLDHEEVEEIELDDMSESLDIDMEESIEITEDEVMADISDDELVLEFEEADDSTNQSDANVVDIEELD